jgi:hypothetical protein
MDGVRCCALGATGAEADARLAIPRYSGHLLGRGAYRRAMPSSEICAQQRSKRPRGMARTVCNLIVAAESFHAVPRWQRQETRAAAQLATTFFLTRACFFFFVPSSRSRAGHPARYFGLVPGVARAPRLLYHREPAEHIFHRSTSKSTAARVSLCASRAGGNAMC